MNELIMVGEKIKLGYIVIKPERNTVKKVRKRTGNDWVT